MYGRRGARGLSGQRFALKWSRETRERRVAPPDPKYWQRQPFRDGLMAARTEEKRNVEQRGEYNEVACE